MRVVPVRTLDELVESGVIQLTRGKIISKKDMAACPGNFPVYSSAKDNDGKFGEYGRFMFDEELITWSVDGGGRLFYRQKHKFSVTNVGGVLRIRDRSVLDYKYLYYVLSLRHSEITFDWVKKAHPSVIKKLYQDIPVPPRPEQHRIVSILDEAFDGIAAAKANAEKNLQNARSLFESHLQSVFTKRGNGWVDRQLASLCHEITVGHVGSMAKEYKESGVPFLRSQNIRPFKVALENVVFIDKAFHRSLNKSRLRPGDLAIVRTGYPGTAAVIPPELPDANCSDLVIVRPSQEVNPHFLAAFFNSAFGKQLVLGKIVGAAQKHFNITAAKEVMLHVPPVPEQHAIIEMVDSLRAETQHLESLYQRKLAALEALKKSLLHQAFTGQLGAQAA
jgi:type I restriction enzyme S subunit